MRIVAGRFRGRRLTCPPGATTRPTSDRLREALFNQLAHGPDYRRAGRAPFVDAVVLDAFAGSGALGFEALSRGALRGYFFDTDPAARAALMQNRDQLKLDADGAQILRADALSPPRAPETVDLVFLDPPYGRGLPEPALSALARAGWIAPGALLVIERDAADPAIAHGAYHHLGERRAGRAIIDIFRTPRDA